MTLDIEKFRKVRALMESGATEGERAAAKSRAEAIARNAGVTLHEAMTATNSVQGPTFTFADFFKNDPHFQQQQKKRDRLKELKRRDVLRRYGSMGAVFTLSPWEISLRKAIETFSLLRPRHDLSGNSQLYTAVLDGEICSDFTVGTERARAAIRSAIQWPNNLSSALIELKKWQNINWDRSAFTDYCWNDNAEVQVRCHLLEEMLDNQPVKSWEDMQARFDWSYFKWSRQWIDPSENERDEPFIERLEADFKILRQQFMRSSPKQRTNRAPTSSQGELFPF